MFPFHFLSDFSGVSSLVLRRICYTLLRRVRRRDVFKADLVTVIDAVKHDIVSMHDIVSRFSDVQDNFFAAAVLIRRRTSPPQYDGTKSSSVTGTPERIFFAT